MSDQVYLNGDFVPLDGACISVMDRGFLFGDGVYEVVPVYGGRLFGAKPHLDRLDRSLAGIGIPNPHTEAEWFALLTQLIHNQGGGDLALYLQVTRGVAPKRDHAFPAEVTPTVFAMCNPIAPVAPELLKKGLTAVTLDDIRWQFCDIKAITLLPNVLMRQQAVEEQAQEAILIKDGLALEGAASNLFLVKDKCLITPPKSHSLLPGITRDLVLQLAREIAAQEGMEVVERDIPENELMSADELWVTSSTREILPITQLDNEPVGNGKPGPIWARVTEVYRDYKQRFRAGEVD